MKNPLTTFRPYIERAVEKSGGSVGALAEKVNGVIRNLIALMAVA